MLDDKIPWTEEELIALADAWCSTSQNATQGTDQNKDTYWQSIRVKLANTMGKPHTYRSTNSITSKWTLMKTKLTKFNGIHMRLSRNPPSGWNEMKILDEALDIYKAESRGNKFTLKKVWERIRYEQKWIALGSSSSRSSGSKRSFGDRGDNSMGSDAHVHVDLNEGMDTFADDEEVDPLHTRPLQGRDKAKRAQKFGATMNEKAKTRETLTKGVEAHVAAIEEKKARRARLDAEHEELIQQQKLINHLTIMEKVGIEEEDKPFMNEARKEARSFFKNRYKNI